MKNQREQELGASIVNHRTGERIYIKDRLRQMKKQREQVPYDHYYQDRDEANTLYEEDDQAVREGRMGPFSN